MNAVPPGKKIGQGVFVERGVKGSVELVDVVHVPMIAANWFYELNPGNMTDDGILQAVNMYLWGVGHGIETGKKQARAEIRKAIGIIDVEDDRGC